MHMVENDGVPSTIPRHRTYSEVDSYVSDLLSLQDSKLRHQPNSVKDFEDGRSRMAALAGLRATTHQFLDPSRRQGPFHLTRSDLHQANIFVDDSWNITTIIDLEWAHTSPAAMQTPPYWLTARPIDGFKEPAHLDEYEDILEEYLAAYADEERKHGGKTWQAGPAAARVALRQRSGASTPSKTPRACTTCSTGTYSRCSTQGHPRLQVYDDVVYWYWRRRCKWCD